MPEIITRKEAKALRAAARARGLKRYFTGKPCKWGHLSDRFVSNTACYDCCKKYFREHREGRATYLRLHRRKNPERTRKYSRDSYRKRALAYRALRELGIQF